MHQASRCSNCGLANFSDVVTCRRCNASLNAAPRSPVAVADAPVQRPMPEMLGKKGIIGIAVTFVLAFFALVAILNYHPQTSASPAPALTSERTLAGPGRTLLAVDERAYDDMMSAAVAKDDAALMRLGADGKVFGVEAGTRVRIIEGGMIKSRVNVLEGRQAGRSGWLPNELMSH